MLNPIAVCKLKLQETIFQLVFICCVSMWHSEPAEFQALFVQSLAKKGGVSNEFLKLHQS